jgi:hypothetical protein
MKKGMKTSMAAIMECVGPRCNGELMKNSKRMSMSGSIERTKINGILKFTLRSFPDALASRYASAMCPTANEAFILLESETSRWLAIKRIGSG